MVSYGSPGINGSAKLLSSVNQWPGKERRACLSGIQAKRIGFLLAYNGQNFIGSQPMG